MQSHEVLKKAIDKTGIKEVASEMSLSASLIYKWCEPADPQTQINVNSPLDRLEQICRITGDDDPIRWLCEKAGGFMVKNPEPGRKTDKFSIISTTQKILQEFSEMLNTVSKSFSDDQQIDEKESARIRKEWEDLKSIAESFVVACEQGVYRK